MELPLRFAPENRHIAPPVYATEGAAGFDIAADLPEDVVLSLRIGERLLIPTGIYVAVPVGWELQVRSRSGLALKNGVVVMNSPGTVDSDYRGEVKVILMNYGNATLMIKPGDRIAQGVICPVEQADFVLVDSLPPTDRGAGGFGSTGV